MLTTDFVPGAPNWLDLGAPDTEAARAFYGGLLGWSFESAGPEAGGYGFFTHGRKTVAALGPLTDAGARSAWTPYFQTPDADATARSVEQAGGRGGAARSGPRRSMSSTRGGWGSSPPPAAPGSRSGSPGRRPVWRRSPSPAR